MHEFVHTVCYRNILIMEDILTITEGKAQV